MAAINSRDEPSWLVAAVSERLSCTTPLPLLHSLSQAAPAGQHMPLHLPKSLTSGSFSCRQSLALPRLMVRYSWWRRSFGVVYKAPNFPHSIIDLLLGYTFRGVPPWHDFFKAKNGLKTLNPSYCIPKITASHWPSKIWKYNGISIFFLLFLNTDRNTPFFFKE